MRPTNKPTGAVWRLLAEWSNSHPLRPSQTQMARFFGVSTSLLSNWKFMESVMQPAQMKAIADRTGIDIGQLAAAVAADHEGGGGHASGSPAAMKKGLELVAPAGPLDEDLDDLPDEREEAPPAPFGRPAAEAARTSAEKPAADEQRREQDKTAEGDD